MVSDSLLPPAAPDFDEPMEMLLACHERLQARLDTLLRLAAWLPEHGADRAAQQAAANVMRYFDSAAVNHHLDEERDLLPALEVRAVGKLADEVHALREWVESDHRRIGTAWSVLRGSLAGIAAGSATTLPEEAVASFVDAYRRHVEREEGELFPLAEILLRAEDLSAMSATMSARRRQRMAD